MKLGLFGGSFDPIHLAHLIIAQFTKEELQLDKVIFIPNSLPPHKSVFAPAELRVRMIERAIADNTAFECSTIELEREGTSYSVDSIAAFKTSHHLKRDELFWIIGSDNFLDLPNWKSPDEIRRICRLVVFPRRDHDINLFSHSEKGDTIFLEDAPIIEISSTLIRSLLRQKRSVNYLLPAGVSDLLTSTDSYF